MFTGLVERLGRVAQVREEGNARHFVITVADEEFLQDAILGESISVNGTCLTATHLEPAAFTVTAVEETLRRTSLGSLAVDSPVNLERALPVSARLGGHIVQGHVDGVATVVITREEDQSVWVTLEPPSALMKYIVEKGSVCLDGVSLTVANVAYSRFSVALIPHTCQVTTAGSWKEGKLVNVEVDILAKYVERLLQWAAPPETPGGPAEPLLV